MPGVFGDVGLVFQAPGEEPVTAWTGKNVLKEGGRSALASFLYSAVGFPPRYFSFGTGTAVPSAQGTALQFLKTAKATAAYSAIGTSGMTARLYCTLGHNELTATTITEIAASYDLLTNAAPYPWAMALVNGGTGVLHPSGKVAVFFWDFALTTGQNA